MFLVCILLCPSCLSVYATKVIMFLFAYYDVHHVFCVYATKFIMFSCVFYKVHNVFSVYTAKFIMFLVCVL